MSLPYEKVGIKQVPKLHRHVESENIRYWSKFRQSHPVTCVDFNTNFPHDFVITSSSTAQIFSSKTNESVRTLSKFRSTAYSARYRRDGQLVVAGSDDGIIRIFDSNSKLLIRRLVESKNTSVRVTRFSTNEHQVLSGNEDGIVSCWDFPSESRIVQLSGHTDRVRSGIVSPSSEYLWVTGSHDNTVRFWDIRSGECINTLRHSSPVEDLAMVPDGKLLISASGNEIYVWDVNGGYRCINTISNHQRVVTNLHVDSSSMYLFASSLDSTVKIYNLKDYKLEHKIRYSAPVLTISASPTLSHIVAGMSDGTLSIKYRSMHSEESTKKNSLFVNELETLSLIPELKIEQSKKQKLKLFDKFLKKFQYKNALDAALEMENSLALVSLFEEFIKREALLIPLSGRNEVTLFPIVHFLQKHTTTPKYTKTLVHVVHALLDLYSSTVGKSQIIDSLYLKLYVKIKEEIKFRKELCLLQGIFDSLFNHVIINHSHLANTEV